MKSLILSLFVVLSNILLAAPAHEHGVASLKVAIENGQGEFEFVSPLKDLIGFENPPKDEKQKKALEELKNNFKTKFEQYFSFEDTVHCQFETTVEDPFEKKGKHQHHDLKVNSKVNCKSPPQQKVVVKVAKFYPKLKKIKVELLSDHPKKVTLTKKEDEVLLGK